jgi:NTE family protein
MQPHPESPLAKLAGKRVGVVLSAGYFGFYGHAGFVSAIEEAGVKPACWGGTSAGALVAAMAAAGLRGPDIADRLCAVQRSDFWDPDPLGAAASLLSGLGATGLLRGARFRRLLARRLPVERFDQLQSPLRVVAANLTRGGAQGFTRGDRAPRVHASCAYPGLFRAAEVDGEHFWDGGLVDKAPVLALHEAFAPEAILVHYLPSRGANGPPRGPLAYAQAMASAYAALRRDHLDLQLELLRRVGVPVAVVTSELEGLGPRKLARGRRVYDEARAHVLGVLSAPAAATP